MGAVLFSPRAELWASAKWKGHHDQMVASSEGSWARGLRKDELDSLPGWLVGLVFVKHSLLLPCTVCLHFIEDSELLFLLFFCQVP